MSSASSQQPPSEFWLLKLPNFLHNQWEEAKKANAQAAANPLFQPPPGSSKAPTLGQPIAHILIEKKQPKTGQRKMKLIVPAPAPTSGLGTMSTGAPTPTEFTFQTRPKSTMLVFGASVPPSAQQLAIQAAKNAVAGAKPQPTPEAFRLDGEVSLLADCMPRTDTDAYRASVMARMEATKAARHTTQMVVEGKDAIVTPAGATMVALKRKESGSASSRSGKGEKRARMLAGELEPAVLTLMSKPNFAFVTISRVAIELQQPLGAVSDMVKKLCIRQEDGLNKGMYTLKPEYRLAGDLDDPAAAAPTPMDLIPAAAPYAAQAGLPYGFAVKSEVKREM